VLGEGQFTVFSNPVLQLNRQSSDGDIAVFRKDGSTVGSIGTKSGALLVESTTCGLWLNGASDLMIATDGAGAGTNGSMDIGSSGNRFKDLHLSGGVYLGGTGAANKLDDYEEGTWTPTLVSGGSVTPYIAYYTKIGQLVTCYCYAAFAPTNNTARLEIGGLPFTKITSPYYGSGHSIAYSGGLNTTNWGASLIGDNNAIYFHKLDGGAQVLNNAFADGLHPLLFSFAYITNS